MQDVTQIEDLERCKTVLIEHGWNIENAVHSALNVPDLSSQSSLNSDAPPNLPQVRLIFQLKISLVALGSLSK